MNLIVQDIPRLYTAIAEWMACMLYVEQFRPRLSRDKSMAVSLASLVIQIVFLVVTDDVHLLLWIPCMALAVFMMMGLIYVLCDTDLKTAAYTCIRAFALAEFTAALEWQLHSFLWPKGTDCWWQVYGLMLLIYGGIMTGMWLLERNCIPSRTEMRVAGNEMWTVVIIGISIFAISNLSFYMDHTPFTSQYSPEIMNIRTLVDFAGVAILFAYHIQRAQMQSAKELDALQTVLEHQYAQYRMSRDTIDMINRKYHDLKHQIAALRTEPDAQIREQWLQAMEADIQAYEVQNKTGNRVLDTVLTGKSLYCQKHGIELLVVADGKRLSFLDVADICTVFGNALDNAIECELKIPDPSKRIIRLVLSAQKQFLLLKVENYCPFVMDFRDGLPSTTKGDASNHGFGLKSIRYTAQKYGGSITTGIEDDWFVLKMLIPLKSSEP